jgi:hypothetical protein
MSRGLAVQPLRMRSCGSADEARPPENHHKFHGSGHAEKDLSVGVRRKPKPRRAARDSLAREYPALAAQWHPTANAPLTPADVTCGSKRRITWVCPSDPQHVWEAILQSRTTMKYGCPYCSGLRVTPETSLPARYPEVAAEWHWRKNGWLWPGDVRYGSERRVWWRCSRNARHVWQARVMDRTCGRVGCPKCPRRRPTPRASLASRFPLIAAEWHPSRNGGLRPTDLFPASNRKVWWHCRRDSSHEWRAVVAGRTLLRTGCPACAGRVVTAQTSLAGTFPKIAKEWHPTRNRTLTPSDVMAHSGRKVWWRCTGNPAHAWRAQINSRTGQGTGCPACANRIVTTDNSLVARFPSVAAEWHPSRNRPFRPDRVTAGSSRRVWWKCRVNPKHAWCARVCARTGKGTGCPACANLMVTDDNSLLAKCPKLARQWHPTRNGSLTAADVTPGSSKTVWWRCAMNPAHEWRALVHNRSRGSGCPDCYRAAWVRRSRRGSARAATDPARRTMQVGRRTRA